jgi:hypothetical protein
MKKLVKLIFKNYKEDHEEDSEEKDEKFIQRQEFLFHVHC